MSVNVDKARRDDQAGDVDRLSPLRRSLRDLRDPFCLCFDKSDHLRVLNAPC